MDHLQRMAGLALGSRLKRISDHLMGDVRAIYRQANVGFEPRWFPLFSLLHAHEEISISKASDALGTTHPHVTKMSRQLEKQGLVESLVNPDDKRSRLLRLSDDGQKLAGELRPFWYSIQKAVEGIMPELGSDFLASLSKLESALQQQSLSERVAGEDQASVEIVSWRPEFARDFARLNKQWLRAYFEVEPIDHEQLGDPERHILAAGGKIFFAMHDDQVVGTCALAPWQNDMELTRMAVEEEWRGRGVGEQLLRNALSQVVPRDGGRLVLFTAAQLLPAIRLYEKHGFVRKPMPSQVKYKRASVFMVHEES